MSTGTSRKTENNGKKKLQRHCEEVCTDHDETREVQEKRIDCFKKKGDRQFTDEGRRAEITVDMVLQARANMSENKVNGPGSRFWKRSTLLRGVFQKRSMGQMEAPHSWTIVKLVFLRKPGAEPKKGSEATEPLR